MGKYKRKTNRPSRKMFAHLRAMTADSAMRRTAYSHTMADQPGEAMDFTDLPLISRSNVLTEAQDAAPSTSATPSTEPPTVAARKPKAQKQREYRQRIAASRTSAQAIAARKSDAERQRNRRLRKAANLVLVSGSLESTTASSSRSWARLGAKPTHVSPALEDNEPIMKMDNTEVDYYEDQAKSAKMKNVRSALNVESEKYEWTAMEKSEQTLPSSSSQFSAEDPLETSVKVEPEEYSEMLADVDGDPAQVELVEVPDSAVGSYINSFIKMVPTEIQQPNLPSPIQSSSNNEQRIQNDATTTNLKLQCQTIIEYTGRDKFDKYDIFSEFVATKLRGLRSADRKVNIMNSIIKLFENYS